jgi:hypothetical protein
MPTEPTPRILTVTIEIDVTEGPRIRRGTTEKDFAEMLGAPLREHAISLAKTHFGLVAQSSRSRTQWGYVWLDATEEDDEIDLSELDEVTFSGADL